MAEKLDPKELVDDASMVIIRELWKLLRQHVDWFSMVIGNGGRLRSFIPAIIISAKNPQGVASGI